MNRAHSMMFSFVKTRSDARRILVGCIFTSVFVCMATLALAETVTYRLTVDNTWSESTHPGLFPSGAHFSWVGGGTHSAAVSFWDTGVLASPGMVQMAETGVTTQLIGEVESAIGLGTASGVLSWQHWFCPSGTTSSSCGSLVVEFDVDDSFPRVTLVSMLGPTPDWFIGVSGLALHDGSDWIDSVSVDLRPYDGGTRDWNIFALGGPLTTPQEPVALITAASGELIGPDSLGSFLFERVSPAFTRGDVNADGLFDIADAVYSLSSLFAGSSAPTCADAADVNDDGFIDIADPVSALATLFTGAADPAAPFLSCGTDPTSDTLSCGSFAGCP